MKRVGVLEYDTLPAGLADDMAAAAPSVEWTDGTALFAGLRREVDEPERGLLAQGRCHRGRRVARGGERQGQGCRHARGLDRAERAARRRRGGLHRGRARSRGGPAAQPHLAADAAGGALRGARFDRLQGLLGAPHAHVCARIPRRRMRGSMACRCDRWRQADRRRNSPSKVKELPGATLTSWIAESCIGSYPLSARSRRRARRRKTRR